MLVTERGGGRERKRASSGRNLRHAPQPPQRCLWGLPWGRGVLEASSAWAREASPTMKCVPETGSSAEAAGLRSD